MHFRDVPPYRKVLVGRVSSFMAVIIVGCYTFVYNPNTHDLTTESDLPDRCAFAIDHTGSKLSLRPTIVKSTYTDVNGRFSR